MMSFSGFYYDWCSEFDRLDAAWVAFFDMFGDVMPTQAVLAWRETQRAISDGCDAELGGEG